VNGQNPPRTSLLLAETNSFVLWRLKWKMV